MNLQPLSTLIWVLMLPPVVTDLVDFLVPKTAVLKPQDLIRNSWKCMVDFPLTSLGTGPVPNMHVPYCCVLWINFLLFWIANDYGNTTSLLFICFKSIFPYCWDRHGASSAPDGFLTFWIIKLACLYLENLLDYSLAVFVTWQLPGVFENTVGAVGRASSSAAFLFASETIWKIMQLSSAQYCWPLSLACHAQSPVFVLLSWNKAEVRDDI